MKQETYHLNRFNSAKGGLLDKSTPCPDCVRADVRLARILSKSLAMSYFDDIRGLHLRTDIWEYAHDFLGTKESTGLDLINHLRKTSRTLSNPAVLQ